MISLNVNHNNYCSWKLTVLSHYTNVKICVYFCEHMTQTEVCV